MEILVDVGQLFLTGLTVGAVYALVAVGFVLIYKASGVFNFAQGEVVMVGGFIGWTFLVALQPYIPLWLGIIFTLVCAGIVGVAMERIFMRPMIGQSLLSMVMMTIALSSLLMAITQLTWGVKGKDLSAALPVGEILKLGALRVPVMSLIGLATTVVLIGLFAWFFKATGAGLAMRATSEDHTVAYSCGISVRRIFSQSWAIGALAAGVGGVVLGSLIGINSMLAPIGIKAIPVVLLGGLESIPGAIIGGLLMGVLEAFAANYFNSIVGGGIETVFVFVVMMVVLLFRPYGLFGQKRIERI